MNLLAKWKQRFTMRTIATSAESAQFEAAPVLGLDVLQARLNQWSHLWSVENESASGSETQQLIAERLAHWMERCFGQHVHRSLEGKSGQISLASSTPIFTAFLGRRATRELSRRILQDI